MLARFGVKKDLKFGYSSFYSTHRVVSTNELKKFHVNPVETCDKKDENLTLTYLSLFTRAQMVLGAPYVAQIARFMGPTWGPSGADRTQMGPMLAKWTLLSGYFERTTSHVNPVQTSANSAKMCSLTSFGRIRTRKGPNHWPLGKGSYYLHIYAFLGVVPVSLKQVSCESSWHIMQNRRICDFLSILALFGVIKEPHIWFMGPLILHTSTCSSQKNGQGLYSTQC